MTQMSIQCYYRLEELKKIILVRDFVYFEVSLIITESFDNVFQSHKIDNSSIGKKYVSCESLLHYIVYHTRDFENFGIYVPEKYELNDLIVRHIDGCNPLFI